MKLEWDSMRLSGMRTNLDGRCVEGLFEDEPFLHTAKAVEVSLKLCRPVGSDTTEPGPHSWTGLTLACDNMVYETHTCR
jgi:hypothetical protein